MAITTALCVHLILYALVIAWRAPAMTSLPRTVGVSLYGAGAQMGSVTESTTHGGAATAAQKTAVSTVQQRVDEIVSAPLVPTPSASSPALLQPTNPNIQISHPNEPNGAAEPSALDRGGGGAATNCRIADFLQTVLQTNSDVHIALGLMPPGVKSVANAVLLWDGRWIDGETVGGATVFDPIHTAVVAGVSNAPAACQMELVRGPRLITVGDSHNTTVLAFGSGEWRWADVLDTRAPP